MSNIVPVPRSFPAGRTRRRLTGPGKVHCVLAGFASQNVITVKEAADAVTRVPDLHLLGLRVIHYDPKRTQYVNGKRTAAHYSSYTPMHRRWAGMYQAHLRRILIHRFDSKKQFEHILYHEIGHHVFRFVMGGNRRNHWVEHLSRKSGKVSDYASTNANEDFAETYSWYMTRKSCLSGSFPEKYRFLRDQIFTREPEAALEPSTPTMDSNAIYA